MRWDHTPNLLAFFTLAQKSPYHANASYPGRCVPGVLLCFEKVGGVDAAVQMRGVERGVLEPWSRPQRRHTRRCCLNESKRQRFINVVQTPTILTRLVSFSQYNFTIQTLSSAPSYTRAIWGTQKWRRSLKVTQLRKAHWERPPDVRLTQSRFQNPHPQSATWCLL